MPGHETDIELIGRTRSGAPEQMPAEHAPESAVLSARAPELSSRALAGGRPGTLDAVSVMHLQSLAGNTSVARLIEDEQASDKVRSVVGQGGGARLDPATASSMEDRFGEDFSDVRIHQGGSASESARAVDAQAYTVGNDVVFGSGTYDSSSPSGQRTLAHELTHVVQQRDGAVSGSDIGGGLAVSHPADRFEQDASSNAERIMASGTPSIASGTLSTAPAVSAQSQVDDEPPAEQSVAQRAEVAGDDEEEEIGSGIIMEGPEEEQDETGSGLIAQREETDDLDQELPT